MPTPPAVNVETLRGLDAQTREGVHQLATGVQARVGEPPLSDQALLRLGSGEVRHLVARSGPKVDGYAQLDGDRLEIVGEVEASATLLQHAEAIGGFALVWSHGRRSPLAEVLPDHGYAPVRVLHQLRRPLSDAIAVVEVAPPVAIRTFRPGSDEQQWLSVNAAAFADHQEQGGWTLADLQAREGQPWFNPDGFFVAERPAPDERGLQLIGFHWTKVHADGAGEVYVLGVDPAAQGLHLGSALLSVGLRYLAARGCKQVLLYVDDDNAPARRLYERFGFVTHDTDTQWARAQTLDTP
ncbi:MAG: mycothiol synthase [Actinomycetota bacterium]|nr:mycothiol synthase [Actinomycetota bacterium]